MDVLFIYSFWTQVPEEEKKHDELIKVINMNWDFVRLYIFYVGVDNNIFAAFFFGPVGGDILKHRNKKRDKVRNLSIWKSIKNYSCYDIFFKLKLKLLSFKADGDSQTAVLFKQCQMQLVILYLIY